MANDSTEAELTEAALQARLLDAQCQSDRWAALAATAQDPSEQERCRKAAEDAQEQAHQLRQELAALAPPPRRRWFDRWLRRRTGPR